MPLPTECTVAMAMYVHDVNWGGRPSNGFRNGRKGGVLDGL